jgi:hypothetical protein
LDNDDIVDTDGFSERDLDAREYVGDGGLGAVASTIEAIPAEASNSEP